ncbi:hypothetical protein ACFLT8_03620 [Chloroflexota bacterium]
MDKAIDTENISSEIKKEAEQRAKDRARMGRWDLDIAIFLFGVMAVVVILSFQGIGVEIVAPVAVFGLAMVWLVGWKRGRNLYQRFYEDELSRLQSELRNVTRNVVEETIEERIQKALRERWK